MTLSHFLDPEGDATREDPLAMEMEILELVAYKPGIGLEEDPEEPIGPVKPVVSLSEARRAVRVLVDFMEGNVAFKTEDLRAMQRLELALASLEE